MEIKEVDHQKLHKHQGTIWESEKLGRYVLCQVGPAEYVMISIHSWNRLRSASKSWREVTAGLTLVAGRAVYRKGGK